VSGSTLTDAKSAACVLVVDDDDAARYAKSRMLRQAGYRVLESVSGGEALRSVAACNPDLILLDVRLPDINGLEVCRRIKANPDTASIPVLQMSASFRDDRSKVAGLEGGADGYITEPVEPTLLVATIGAFLRTRAAEQSVRDLALEWQVTFEAISDGVALVDLEGRIVRSNAALALLLGRPAGELAGVPLNQLLPPAPGESDLWRGLKPGNRQQAERTAGARTFLLTVDPVADGGRPRGGVCIVRDVTERKLMDQRLWHTQKLESIGVLAGGVAHDFNNLLTGILGNASLALQSLDEPAQLQRGLDDIVRASERAADLTRQLLAYSGKGRFVVEEVDLSRLVREILPLLEASFLHQVDLMLDLAGNLPLIQADKTQIEQIVMNLVINAAEAIGEKGGTVTVTTGTRRICEDQRPRYLTDTEVCGDYVMLEVRDRGAGMDEATLRRIFDPFFTTKFMGRGLGLSAVLGILRGHKGAIRVESAPGRGTTFELLFPVSREAAAAERRQAQVLQHDSYPACGRILVVDDEQIVRDFFRSALRQQGYEVVTAVNGAEALRIFGEAADTFHLVVLDLVMPVLNGKETLRRLRAVRPDTPIVVTSGQVEEEVRRDLGSWNIAGYVQKPCAVATLLEVVRESLRVQAVQP
jgi:PAS domain S-box-containing protein